MEHYEGEIYGQFHLALPIQKSYSVTENGETKMVIAGVASGVSVDLEADRMTDAAIHAFQSAVEKGVVDKDGQHSLIPLRTGHRKEWNDVLGYVTKATVDEDRNLWIEAELDETSSVARDLFHKLRVGSRPGKPLKLGFSVGGFITKARNEFDALSKKKIRVIEDVLLDEISVVGQPAYAPSFLDVLTKSTRWDDVPTYYQEENSMTLRETTAKRVAEELQKDAPAVDPSTARVEDEAPQPNDNVNTDNVAEVDATAEVVDPVAEEEAARAAAVEQAKADAQEADTNTDAANVEFAAESNDDNALKELQDQIRALQDTVAQLLAAQQNASAVVVEKAVEEAQPVVVAADQAAETVVVTPDVLNKSNEKLIVDAVTNALVAFKAECLDPLVKELTEVKNTVETIAATPMDKSVAVSPTSAPMGSVEQFRKRFAESHSNNPIRESVLASLNREAN
jgi:phage head maturation protease